MGVVFCRISLCCYLADKPPAFKRQSLKTLRIIAKKWILYVRNCRISIKSLVRFISLQIKLTCKMLMQPLPVPISTITEGVTSHLCRRWLRGRNHIDFSVNLISSSISPCRIAVLTLFTAEGTLPRAGILFVQCKAVLPFIIHSNSEMYLFHSSSCNLLSKTGTITASSAQMCGFRFRQDLPCPPQ